MSLIITITQNYSRMGFTPVSPSQQRPLVAFTTLVTRLIDATTASSESGFTRAQFVGGFFREVRVCLCRQTYLLDRAVASFITQAPGRLLRVCITLLRRCPTRRSSLLAGFPGLVVAASCTHVELQSLSCCRILSRLAVGVFGFPHGALVLCCFLS
jgi:hypothetical protein